MKGGACFDPAIGRFLFLPLDGPVIPDKLTHRLIDNAQYATLEQFVIILSFVENVIFTFEDDAITDIVTWGNSCKQRSEKMLLHPPIVTSFLGFDERNNDECLSARLGKAVQQAYRLATFIQTIEIGFEISQHYTEHHQSFPANGSIDDEYIDNIVELFRMYYPSQFRATDRAPFQVSKDVVSRSIDLISCNMRQFMLLFDGTYAPKVSSIGRSIVVLSPDQRSNASDSSVTRQNHAKMNVKRKMEFVRIQSRF
jgi:hypothetical protein